MCGRYSVAGTELTTLAERFDAKPRLESFEASSNIKPTQLAPVVVQHDGHNALERMKWGLIPGWAKDDRMGNKTFNARAETVAEKPTFRHAFKKKRCLVPARAFYEWRTEHGKKVPYQFTVGESELFAFAGLYEVWKAPSGEPVYSYTILTTTANDLVKEVHPERMPVILPREVEAVWLDTGIENPHFLQSLLVPYPAELMQMQQYAGTL
jgi:putative SOS response-associated peptidase YedK